MEKRNRKKWLAGLCLLAAFALWTAAVCIVDVQAIGPQGLSVGFAAINGFVHNLTGVHMSLYTVTDWLGLIPVAFAAGFGLLGLAQWVGRKEIGKVDRSILALGGFYLAVLTAYLFFEEVVINYRPILIDGAPEASYPSSTTVLVLCVMPTAAMQLKTRVRNRTLRRCAVVLIGGFTVFMVIGRFWSGVHWLTDIVGGILLSAGLVMLYDAASGLE